MKHIQLFLITVALLFSSILKAGENITPKDLEGSWKMTDIKITNSGKTKTVTKDNCYLCDLYKAKLGLVFTADGKVDYSNYGNPHQVQYNIRENILTVFSETDGETQLSDNMQTGGKKAGTSVAFHVSLSNNVLILSRVDPDFTETYILTK